MKAFLILCIVLRAINILWRGGHLCVNFYPRTLVFKPRDDVIGLLISIALGLWALYLLITI